MYFDLNEDQKAIRDAVARFLDDQLDPVTALKLSDAGVLDASLWGGARELGLTAVMVEQAQGGLGMDLLTLAVIAGEMGRTAAPIPVVPTALAAWLVSTFGSDPLRARWLASLLSGEVIAAFALDEDVSGGPETWSVETHGRKISVEWGAQAQLLFVGLAGGRIGVFDASAPGVTISSSDPLDRTRPFATVELDDAPNEILAGENIGRRVVDALLVLLAADAFGAASRAISLSVQYAKERNQFGQPIGAFQAVKHQLADMVIDVEPARALFWYAAHAWDAIPEEAERSAALAKAHIGTVAARATRKCVEVHGGIGYTWEYPLHLWLKRAMYDRSAMGGPNYHRKRAAALAGW